MPDLSTRVLCPGDRLAQIHVLVACEHGHGPVRGLRVRVGGDAIARGLVEVTRARARPWSARLAPWQLSAWEHTLEPDHDGWMSAVLRGPVLPPRSQRTNASGNAKHDARTALSHAVWVQIDGCARTPGEGMLHLQVASLTDDIAGVQEHIPIRVQTRRPPAVTTAYMAWCSPLSEQARSIRTTLDRFAMLVTAFHGEQRTMIARGIAPDRLHLPSGYVTFCARGVRGDARWRALLRRMRTGKLERLTVTPTEPITRDDHVLEVAITHSMRFVPGPVEMALSVGNARTPEEKRNTWIQELATLVRQAKPVHGFVAEHDWVQDFLELTPWERASGREPARTIDAIRQNGRVDPSAAFAVIRE